MYSTKQHIVRKSLIVLVSFIGGIATSVLASSVYDANVQSRATKMFSAITNNASKLDPIDIPNYYSLVHLNIQSLIQVLTSVDASVMTALSQAPVTDDDATQEVSNVTPAKPSIAGSNAVSRGTNESYRMEWTPVAGVDYYVTMDPSVSSSWSNAYDANWTIPLSGFVPGSTHTGALKACATGTAICSPWSTVTINIAGGVTNNSTTTCRGNEPTGDGVIKTSGQIQSGTTGMVGMDTWTYNPDSGESCKWKCAPGYVQGANNNCKRPDRADDSGMRPATIQISPSSGTFNMTTKNTLTPVITGVTKENTLVCNHVIRHPGFPSVEKPEGYCNNPANFAPFSGNEDWTYRDGKWIGSIAYNAGIYGAAGIKVKGYWKDKSTGAITTYDLDVIAGTNATSNNSTSNTAQAVNSLPITGTFAMYQDGKLIPKRDTVPLYVLDKSKGNVTYKWNIKNAEGCRMTSGYSVDGIGMGPTSNMLDTDEYWMPAVGEKTMPLSKSESDLGLGQGTKKGFIYYTQLRCGPKSKRWTEYDPVSPLDLNFIEVKGSDFIENNSTSSQDNTKITLICAQNGWPSSIEISGNDNHHTIAKKDGQFLRHVSDFSSSSDNIYRAQLNGDETSIEVHPINSNGTPLATVNVGSCVQRNYPAKPEILSAEFDSTTKTLTVQTKNALDNDNIDIYWGDSYGGLFWTKNNNGVYSAKLTDPYYKNLISFMESGKSNIGVYGSFEPNYWRNGVRNTRYPITIVQSSFSQDFSFSRVNSSSGMSLKLTSSDAVKSLGWKVSKPDGTQQFQENENKNLDIFTSWDTFHTLRDAGGKLVWPVGTYKNIWIVKFTDDTIKEYDETFSIP